MKLDRLIDKHHVYHDYLVTNLAYMELMKENYPQAEKHYQNLLTTYKKKNDSVKIAEVYHNLGNVYFEQFLDRKALTSFQKALFYADHTKDIFLKEQIYYNLYLTSESLQDHPNALKYFKKYTVFKDSVNELEQIWRIAKQEKEIITRKKNVEIKHATIQRNHGYSIALLLLFGSSIIIYMYRKIRLKNKITSKLNRELEQSNKTKNHLFSVIGHDLRSLAFSVQSNLTELQIEPNKELINETYSIASNTYKTLDNLLHWSLSQTNLISLNKRWINPRGLIEQVLYDFEVLIKQKQLRISNSIGLDSLVYVDLETMKIAIRNIIDNSIKFTPSKGLIFINACIKNNTYILCIHDTGIGIHNTEKIKKMNMKRGSGLGMQLIKSMLEKNNATLEIESINDQGTSLYIRLLHFKKIN